MRYASNEDLAFFGRNVLKFPDFDPLNKDYSLYNFIDLETGGV